MSNPDSQAQSGPLPPEPDELSAAALDEVSASAQGEPERELDLWITQEYDRAWRTARLLLRSDQEAQDAVQDAFLRVWRFRSALPPAEARRAWLYRVVVNASISRMRAAAVRPTAPLESAAEPIESSPGPELSVELSERSATVAAALAQLPESLRVVLVLRFWSGLSEKEIATAINRRPGTVKSRMSQARALLSQDPHLLELFVQAHPRPHSDSSPTSTLTEGSA